MASELTQKHRVLSVMGLSYQVLSQAAIARQPAILYEKTVSTFKEYTQYDGLGLAELVAQKQVSPADLLTAAIDELEKWNPLINTVVHKMYEEAAKTLEALPEQGQFRGVPFLIKDLSLFYKGQPTTYASRYLADFVPPQDSELMRRYRQAGLVTFAKTNSPEFGLFGVTEPVLHGITKNPWNLERTPGGSSGGSGAAVAARIVPMAHGGDGGGSIRIPASACGLVGLKPSRARMPIGPNIAESWMGFVVDHCLTRSVRDTAAMLDCTHGYDGIDGFFVPKQKESYLSQCHQHPGKLKIAFWSQSLLGKGTHEDCLSALKQTLSHCEAMGHQIKEARPDFDRAELVDAYLKTISVSLYHDLNKLQKFTGRPLRAHLFEPTTWFVYQLGSKISAGELMRAMDCIRKLRFDMFRFFKDYDVFVTPTLAYPPSTLGLMDLKSIEKMALAALRHYPARAAMNQVLKQMAETGFERTPNTQIFNMSGCPAISLPLYWNSENLPIGVQFGAAFGREDLLIQLASQFEQKTPWSHRAPQLPL